MFLRTTSRGRSLVLTAIGLMLASSLLATVLWFTVDEMMTVRAILRLGTTAALAAALYSGRGWAYTLTLVGLGFGTVLSAVMTTTLGPTLAVMAGLYGLAMAMLVMPSARSFLKAKRWGHDLEA